eukprot:GILI01013891.1.p1 GENE.GILI01013891.1~~GILI01013891.1.p1  ORF type:complete len:482 (+),score=29.84 GILI01013891.1:54-1499(+)
MPNYPLALWKAIEGGHHDDLQQLINDPKCDLTATLRASHPVVDGTLKSFKINALQYAVEKCEAEMVYMLLASGRVNINAKDKDGRTALHYAALRQSVTLVRMLVEDPLCDLNVVEAKHGFAPIHLCLRHLREGMREEWPDMKATITLEILNILLSQSTARCNVNVLSQNSSLSILHLGCTSLEIVEAILGHEAFTSYAAQTSGGRGTALRHTLRMNQNFDPISVRLIQSGHFNLQEKDVQQRTLLHDAVLSNKLQSTIELLKQDKEGTMRYAGDSQGQTTLLLAISAGSDLEIIEALLISCGDRVAKSKDSQGNNALHIAATNLHRILIERKNERLRVLKYLIDTDLFEIDALNSCGMSPLLCLMKNTSVRPVDGTTCTFVKELLQRGANASLEDSFGESALAYLSRTSAAAIAYAEMNVATLVTLLFDHGADTSSQNSLLALRESGKYVSSVCRAEGVLPPTEVSTQKTTIKQPSRCVLM